MDIMKATFTIWILCMVDIYTRVEAQGCEITSKTVTCRGPNITGIPENISETTEEVRIEHADIRTLNTSALSRAQNLFELHVEHSGVTGLVDNAFSDLLSLYMISFKGNKLTTLQRGIFSNLKLLKQLRLSENQLVSIDGAFDGLSGLEILSLNNNQLTEIPKDMFKDTSSLHHLELNENKIREVHPLAFENMRQLMLVGLGSNPIPSVRNIFSTNTILQYLNMTECELTEFPNDLPSSLKYIKLSKNRIQQISKADTSRYVHLNALILEDNGLTNVEPGTFSQMTALTDIFLFVNNLDRVPGPFPRSIKSIYLDNNKIGAVLSDTFENGTNLGILSLRINNISSLSLDAFNNLDSIKELHLERNPFTVLHDDTFKQARGLKYLNLNRLTLTAVYPNCFLNLNSLTKLEMSFVHVSKDQVHGNIFRNLPVLEELALQESPTLATVFLTNLIIEHKKIKSVKKLNLEGNGLEALSSDLQSYLPNLQALSLGGNRFKCNANLLWLRNWYNIEPEKFPKFNQVRCHTPEYLQGKQIQDVKIWQFYDQTGTRNDSDFTTAPSASYTPQQPTYSDYHDTTPLEYIYYNYEELYPYDYMPQSTKNVPDIPNVFTFATPSQTNTTPSPTVSSTTQEHLNETASENNNNDGENNNIQVQNETPKPKKRENSSSLKTVGIAFGMAIGVIAVMLVIAFFVFKVWKRRHQSALQNGRHQNGGQDYVFISTHTSRQDKPEPKVHRKLSRAERGSTTSRASEDITNQTDTDMKVYMMDVDA